MCIPFCFILSSFQSRRSISNSSADASQQYFDFKETPPVQFFEINLILFSD